ncbi:MAG: RNA polymerase sigma factor [Candidatus Limnocylindria bacterium]
MVGDEAELFERYHDRLLRATAYKSGASRDNVDEACAFAWATLLRRGNGVSRETVYPWLKEVAQNEAWRLQNLNRGHIPLGTKPGEIDPGSVVAHSNPYVSPEALGEAMDRLRTLPENLQRVVGMRAFGWKYAEIADELGVSYTRVNNLLRDADEFLHRFREQEFAGRDTRTTRLRDLESEPPPHLRSAIGTPPRFNRRRTGAQLLLRDWRRLALAIDEHRDRHGVTDSKMALGPGARTPAERAARDALRDRIDRFMYQRGLAESRGR